MQPVRNHYTPSDIAGSPTPHQRHNTSIIKSSAWMFGITMVLFFLPLINGLVGGLVGGYKAGSVARGLIAGVLPAILASGALWLLLAALDLPVVGVIAGAAVGLLILLADLGIFIGAVIGGLLARSGK